MTLSISASTRSRRFECKQMQAPLNLPVHFHHRVWHRADSFIVEAKPSDAAAHASFGFRARYRARSIGRSFEPGRSCRQAWKRLADDHLNRVGARPTLYARSGAGSGRRCARLAGALPTLKSIAGVLRESVALSCASSCQFATGAPLQVIEFTGYLERITRLIMPGSRVRAPPFPLLIQARAAR